MISASLARLSRDPEIQPRAMISIKRIYIFLFVGFSTHPGLRCNQLKKKTRLSFFASCRKQ